MSIPILVITGYLVLVTLAGAFVARRNRSSSDWAIAGGGMGVAMIAVGAAGTRIGGAGTYGVAGDVIQDGVWNMWWYGIATFLAMLVVGVFFARAYRRAGLQTVGEIFTLRFGARRTQVLTSLCVQTEYFIINVIEAYIIAVLLKGIVGLDVIYGVFIAAFVLVTYISLGGLWGAAITNLIHCAVIVVGLFAINAIGIAQFGGWEAVTSAVDGHLAGAELDHFWAFAGAGWGAVLAMIFSVVIHTPAASVYTNYATSARHERVLLPAFLTAGVIGGLMPILAGGVGILTLANYGLDTGTASYTNITRVAMDIHPLIGALALAAVLAAVISSGGPILLASATMFVRDWLPFTRDYDAASKLRAYRATTAIYGIVAALLAWVNSAYLQLSVLDMLLFGFAMVVPPAIAVSYLIYWQRTTESAVFWGTAAGFAGGLAWFAAIQWARVHGFTLGESPDAITRLLHWCFVHDGRGIDPSYVTTLVPLIAIPLISLATARHDDKGKDFYAILAGRARARPAT